MSYNIGQVVYLLLKKEIIPAVVFKEVAEKTINGTVVEYIVHTLPKQELFISTVLKEGGEVFKDPFSLKEALVARATKAISAYIEVAVKKASQLQPKQDRQEQQQQAPQQVQADISDVPQTIVLPNGQGARIRMPAALDDEEPYNAETIDNR